MSENYLWVRGRKGCNCRHKTRGPKDLQCRQLFFSLIFRVDKPFLPRRFVEPCGKCKFGGGKNQKKNTEIC